MEDWAGIYKFIRLAVLAFALVAIAIYVYRPSKREQFEEPARRMLEEDS